MLHKEIMNGLLDKYNSSINHENFEHNWKKFFKYIIVAYLAYFFATYYIIFFGHLDINEKTYYNDDTSYPFTYLEIKIDTDYNLTTYIEYKRKNYNVTKGTFENENKIDINQIKSKLKVKELILEDEFEDYLAFFFKIKKNIKNISASIELWNKIYTFDPSYDINIAKETYRGKRFFIENELYYSEKGNDTKVYIYDILAHKIKTLNNTYNFSVLSGNEKIRYRPKEIYEYLQDYNFGIFLEKKIFLNIIEIKSISIYEIIYNSYGTIFSVFNFLVVVLIIISYFCKVCFKICLKMKKNSLTNNKVSQNDMRELDDLHLESGTN